MDIGIPVEMSGDNRLALTPQSVALLCENGNNVFVETKAGDKIHFFDDKFDKAGAKIVLSHQEVYEKANLVVKTDKLAEKEVDLVREEQIITAFHHLAVCSQTMVDKLIEKKATIIGYELIEDENGQLPVLYPTSEIAGQVSIQIAAEYLKIIKGGRGIVLGGIPGVPPAIVVIIGAGTVGKNACMAALGAGAQVIVLDKDMNKLRDIERLFQKRAITSIANKKSIERAISLADVVIGAVLIKGEKSPHVITRNMLKKMKKGSLIIDLSIDQGGCVETSKPTTPKSPVYKVQGITHYCVPNIPSCVGWTGTLALDNVLSPYVELLAEKGLEKALQSSYSLRKGVYIYRGIPIHPVLQNVFGYTTKKIDSLL